MHTDQLLMTSFDLPVGRTSAKKVSMCLSCSFL